MQEVGEDEKQFGQKRKKCQIEVLQLLSVSLLICLSPFPQQDGLASLSNCFLKSIDPSIDPTVAHGHKQAGGVNLMVNRASRKSSEPPSSSFLLLEQHSSTNVFLDLMFGWWCSAELTCSGCEGYSCVICTVTNHSVIWRSMWKHLNYFIYLDYFFLILFIF